MRKYSHTGSLGGWRNWEQFLTLELAVDRSKLNQMVALEYEPPAIASEAVPVVELSKLDLQPRARSGI
jgi:hypothetical protein